MKDKVRRHIIRTSWVNRALIYWIPILFFTFMWPNFVWFMDSFDLYESLKTIMLIGAFILFFEYRIYGFRIELSPEWMIYRERGFPLFSQRKMEKKAITNFKPVYFGKSKFRSAYIELDLAGKKVFVNIASFKPSDVKIIENWLDSKSMGSDLTDLNK